MTKPGKTCAGKTLRGKPCTFRAVQGDMCKHHAKMSGTALRRFQQRKEPMR